MTIFVRHKGEIHLGELIEALASLHPQGPAQAQLIAGCLGFGLSAPDLAAPDRPTPMVYDRSRPSPLANPANPAPLLPPGLQAPRVSTTPVELPGNVLPAQLRELDPEPTALANADSPDWLEADYQRLDPTPGVSPRRQPLFRDRTARGLLIAALSTRRQGQEIDVRALVRCVVRGRLPRQLPRLPSATLAQGCQLLLDFSDSMLPWWEDLHALTGQVEGVLGRERVSVFDFPSSPAAAIQWQAGMNQATHWRPEAGRPILIATAFGILGRRRSRDAGSDWQTFVKRCAALHCPVLILVPWSRSAWPADLGPQVELVHWHPGTSAAMLSRQLGAGHRAAR